MIFQLITGIYLGVCLFTWPILVAAVWAIEFRDYGRRGLKLANSWAYARWHDLRVNPEEDSIVSESIDRISQAADQKEFIREASARLKS